MSKDLEEIIDDLPYSIRYSGEIEPFIKFAKEQAKRIERLEEDLEESEKIAKMQHDAKIEIEKLCLDLEEKLKEQIESNWKLDKINRMVMQKNKRYRETLEFYANRENYNPKHYDPNSDNGYMSTIDYDEGEKARQALESVGE